ncbi:MAG: hypothetical protein IPO00_08675 [Betaproteobacteria bacterium]|nr:hypothetical protein [Betaproteobacteria bacterium]
MSSNPFADFPPMSEEELDACAARLETLPEEHADWVMPCCWNASAPAPAHRPRSAAKATPRRSPPT